MNYTEAFKILEIDLTNTNLNDITLEYVKKQYRKLALKNHPDKNDNTQESNEKFIQINDAYHYLKAELTHLHDEGKGNIVHDVDVDVDDISDDTTSSIYYDILHQFVKTIFEGTYNEIISKVISNIITTGKKISETIFDELDRDTALNIYTFLSNNRQTLHINEMVLEKIRDIVVNKYKNVEVYKLNPSINDLLNNNLYKLYISGELFLVPLWHNETFFDFSGCEIIVISEPELPNGVRIDEDNNLLIDTFISLQNDLPNLLFSNDGLLKLHICEKEFSIPLSKLYMKKEQQYIIKNAGLTKIKKDVYDISEKSDIIVTIYMT